MACGCCAVASSVGGNLELVAEGRTGRLFKPGDAGELVAVLGELIVNDAAQRDLAAAGCRNVHERFSLAASARRMEEIYTALLDRG